MSVGETGEYDNTRDAVAALFRAWRAEIAQLAREHLPTEPAASELEIVLEEGGLVVTHLEPKGAVLLGRIGDDDQAQATLARLIARAGLVGKDVTLRASDALVFRPSIKLPWARRRTLKAALGYELERLTPIEPEALYFDFTVQGRDAETNQARVSLRIVHRSAIDEALRLCHGAGLSVGVIAFGADERPADIASFPLDRPAWLRAQWRRYGTAALAGLAALLLMAVLFAGYERGEAANDALAASVDDAMMRASVVEHMQNRINSAGREVASLVGKREGPLFVGALAELSRLLPDGTWLTELHLEDGKFRADGYSKDASALIATVDRSGVFTNAQFSAPLVRNPGDGTDRFELTFERVAQGKAR